MAKELHLDAIESLQRDLQTAKTALDEADKRNLALSEQVDVMTRNQTAMADDLLEELEKTNRQSAQIDGLIQKCNAKDFAIRLLAKCPWPESVWPMTDAEYVEAVPDEKLRTAISGYLMRKGWECARSDLLKGQS